MPIFWNPFRIFSRASEKPAQTTTTTTTTAAPPSAVGQAGLFETNGLVRDARLDQLRRAQPPTNVQELESNDPRDKRVVYRQESGRGVRLNHGSIIEGSVDFGGMQPNYVVDLLHPRLKAMLGEARALNVAGKSLEDKVNGVVALVQKTLTQGAYDAPAYLKLMAENRQQRTNITLGDYLMHGAGVCRENALLTHLALLEAGVESEYLYCQAAQGGRSEDHAVAVAVDDKGRKIVVDSYNRNFHGFFLDDLTRPGGSRARDKRLPGSTSSPSMYGCTLSVAAYPVYWIPVRALFVRPLPMPPIDQLSNFRVVRPSR
ncbi:MAG: transglutaminase-like domain-containing protein [Deltaproteobacteria bacterium]|nr:transglutaminase-like domain-containing protein [Deltaproteobacteria bacterium]